MHSVLLGGEEGTPAHRFAYVSLSADHNQDSGGCLYISAEQFKVYTMHCYPVLQCMDTWVYADRSSTVHVSQSGMCCGC